MNDQVKQKIIGAIQEKNMSLKDVAKKLYISEHHLKILLHGWGVELPKKRVYRRIPRPDRTSLMQLYSKYGNLEKVAEYLRVGINTVNRWMKEMNIPTKKLRGMTDQQKADYIEKHIEKLENVNL